MKMLSSIWNSFVAKGNNEAKNFLEIEEAKKERYERSYEVSKQISSINRQLAMAGMALSWMFRFQKEVVVLTNGFFICLLFIFVLAIILDFLYYLFVYSLYIRYATDKLETIMIDPKSKKGIKKVNPMPKQLRYISNTIWYLRIALVFLGYLIILFHLVRVEFVLQ